MDDGWESLNVCRDGVGVTEYDWLTELLVGREDLNLRSLPSDGSQHF